MAVNPTAHSLACLRIGVFVTADAARLATGVGGSPFTGRVSHPLDGKQSFMTSPHRHSPLTSLAWSHCAPTPVVTVGMIHGGTRFNIIPGAVALEGTVRTYDPAVQDIVERRIREILDGVTRAGGGAFELDYDRIVPVTINDPALTERSIPSLVAALGEDQVTMADPWMAGEDFSRFANEVPGFFYMLGTLAPSTTSGDHHSPTFRAADGALPMAYTVWDYLSDPPTP